MNIHLLYLKVKKELTDYLSHNDFCCYVIYSYNINTGSNFE